MTTLCRTAFKCKREHEEVRTPEPSDGDNLTKA